MRVRTWTMAAILGAACGAPACKRRDAGADVKVVNGAFAAAGQFPQIHYIDTWRFVPKPGGANGDGTVSSAGCTSSFITQTLMLTAAHCVEKLFTNAGYETTLGTEKAAGGDGFISESFVIMHKDYVEGQNQFDLALIAFRNTTGAARAVAKLGKAPAAQDPVRLAGYGIDGRKGDLSGFSTTTNQSATRWGTTWPLRFGFNKVAEVSDEYIKVEGPGNQGTAARGATAAKGDSGGALWNDKEELIGIASTAAKDTWTWTRYVNTNGAIAAAFLANPRAHRIFDTRTGAGKGDYAALAELKDLSLAPPPAAPGGTAPQAAAAFRSIGVGIALDTYPASANAKLFFIRVQSVADDSPVKGRMLKGDVVQLVQDSTKTNELLSALYAKAGGDKAAAMGLFKDEWTRFLAAAGGRLIVTNLRGAAKTNLVVDLRPDTKIANDGEGEGEVDVTPPSDLEGEAAGLAPQIDAEPVGESP